jgi:hypothetical protein
VKAVVAVALLVLGAGSAEPGEVRSLEVEPAAWRLDGPDRRAQLVVTGRDVGGRPVDLTHDAAVRFEPVDPGVLSVSDGGEVRPVGDGETAVTVRLGGLSATVRVVVTGCDDLRPVDFAAEVVPIFTRVGCNAGACHGKSTGQNGFRLSLLGSDPAHDYEGLAREGRGRRVFPAAPSLSLVLRKPTAALPHGGGKRLEVGSPEYRTIARWVAQGAPRSADPGAPAELTAVEVRPALRRLPSRATQQLRVVARRADGSEADVTRLARFETNAPDLAAVDGRGLVTALDGVGEAAVAARFGGLVGVARFVVPSTTSAPLWMPPPPRNLIDPHVFGRLRELGIAPSLPCTDAEFARRSSLDVCGVLPRPDEVEAFEADPDPDKRLRWVDRLLERPEYADRFAMLWSALLRNQRTLGSLSQPGTFAFHSWVREAIAENRPFDRFVAELLTARGDPARNPAVVWYRHAPTTEALADDTAQLFLGVRLQCARCHHHPSERWGQADYEGFAALFRRVGRKPGPDPVTPRVFLLPASQPQPGAPAPRVLGGPPLDGLKPSEDPRQALADWLRHPDNPYFARAVVNRYWKHFFGRGLVEPEDDFRASNPATNPELLDALAADFVAQGYDLKRLVRTIATSRAYERSSAPNEWNARDRQNFARFAPRRMPAEVLLDAIDTVTGAPRDFGALPPGTRAVQLPDEAFDTPGRFLDVFGRPKRETVCECERSSEANLSQSLYLLNSPEVEHAVRTPEGRAARWASDARPDAEKVAELYRVALSRPPTTDERAVCLAHLARRRFQGRLREGFEDLVWTLINTKEFQFVQ